jgi:S-adenosylmethionine synthetase
MKNVVIEYNKTIPAPYRDSEIVERKGKGHPDSLIDGIMEKISQTLSQAYLEEFGHILHHNVDKGQVCAGEVEVTFGGGKFLQPIYILLSGRASEGDGKRTIPVQTIALETAVNYIKEVLPNIRPGIDVIVDSKIGRGSQDLTALFNSKNEIPLANDTSFGTGYAPFSKLEQSVKAIENTLNSPSFKHNHPELGSDIKVMGARFGDNVKITVAAAFIAQHVNDRADYEDKKEKIREEAQKIAEQVFEREVEVNVNTADDEEVFLTLTGTSAEMGDDGSVGRGNRVNGLITPMRAMTLEAAAGKNPVNHVGKLYSIASFEIANRIYQETGVDVTVTLLSQIGKPINEPKLAAVDIYGSSDERTERLARSIVEEELNNITQLTYKLVKGEVSVF